MSFHIKRFTSWKYASYFGLAYSSLFMKLMQTFFLESTQLEDPRQEWRAVQEAMLREYLQTAQDVLEVSGINILLISFQSFSSKSQYTLN